MPGHTLTRVLTCCLFPVALLMSFVSGSGRVVFEGPVQSRVLGTNRIVRIYLPPSYERQSRKHYPVLYLHDGQNVFTTVGDRVAFGWGNWHLDETVTELSKARKMEEIIMVAVDCGPERYLDYRGPVPPGENSRFEKYARFLIEELKPKIDLEYRSRREAVNTGSMGSSMGGICSLALAWEHPEVFGQAASLSGAFQVERKFFLKNILSEYRGSRKRFRIYLDSGITDFSGGDDGRRDTDAIAAELRRIGWKDGKDLLHYVDAELLTEPDLERSGLRRDKWKETQISQHNELYWRMRAWRALTFLFPTP